MRPVRLIVAIASFIRATTHSAIRLLEGKLLFLDVISYSRGLSIAGGVTVAYVLVPLLSKSQGRHEVLRKPRRMAATNVSHKTCYACWSTRFGLRLWIGAGSQSLKGYIHATSNQVFWLHIVSYAIYNVLLGIIHGDTSLVKT
ncbi:MAG: hypothetical protein CME33_10670 [Gimesia sp.]|nr:hypothetical protein [Gimesia sp.]